MWFSTIASRLPSWLLFILFVVVVVGLAYFGLTLVRGRQHWADNEEEAEKQEKQVEKVTAPVTAFVGLLYAILIGLIIVRARGKYTTADQAVSTEAAAIISAARNSTSLPEPLRSQVQGYLMRYTDLVINEDWPLMAWRPAVNGVPRSSNELNQLWVRYGSEINDAPLGEALMFDLNTIGTQRTIRLDLSREGLPDALWFLFLFGGAILLYLNMRIRTKQFKDHLIMIILMSATLAVFFWIIADTDNPFGGTFHVSTAPFDYALQFLHTLTRR